MTSPHLFYLGQMDAEREVRRGLRGAGPLPAEPVRDGGPRRRGGAATALRVHLATALIRAGETLGGAAHRGGETDTAGVA